MTIIVFYHGSSSQSCLVLALLKQLHINLVKSDDYQQLTYKKRLLSNVDSLQDKGILIVSQQKTVIFNRSG